MASKADNTDFAIEIVDKFIDILKKHVHEDKTVEKGSYIDEYGILQGKGIEKFKSEMLNIFSGNFPVPKDDDIFTVDDVLRYYETINLDIEGSKKILDTFDSVDRVFEIPSPLPEEIAAATAKTEGVSNVVPSGAAGDLVRILDDKNSGKVGQDQGFIVSDIFYENEGIINMNMDKPDETFKSYNYSKGLKDETIYIHIKKKDGSNITDEDVKKILSGYYMTNEEKKLPGEEPQQTNKTNNILLNITNPENLTDTGSTGGKRAGDDIFLENDERYKGLFKLNLSFNNNAIKEFLSLQVKDEGGNVISTLGKEIDDGKASLNLSFTIRGSSNELLLKFSILVENKENNEGTLVNYPSVDAYLVEKFGEVEQPQEPVPSPAPITPPQPVPSPAPIPQPQGPMPPQPQGPVPSQGPRPQPGKEIQENITIYSIKGEDYNKYKTIELEIAKDNLEKLNEELAKPPPKPNESRLVIKLKDYNKAKQDYLEALERGILYNNLVYQFEADTKAIAQRRGGGTSAQDIINEIDEVKTVKGAKDNMESLYNLEGLDNAKKFIEANIAYLEERDKVVQDKLKAVDYVDAATQGGGGKKKRTHNKKKRRSKKKSTPVKKKK